MSRLNSGSETSQTSGGAEGSIKAKKSDIGSHRILSKEQAIEIFEIKNTIGPRRLTATSIALAKKYNVSSKAIRDIWNGRSWLDTTLPLWTQVDKIPLRRPPGRPQGSRDRKQRRQRLCPNEPSEGDEEGDGEGAAAQQHGVASQARGQEHANRPADQTAHTPSYFSGPSLHTSEGTSSNIQHASGQMHHQNAFAMRQSESTSHASSSNQDGPEPSNFWRTHSDRRAEQMSSREFLSGSDRSGVSSAMPSSGLRSMFNADYQRDHGTSPAVEQFGGFPPTSFNAALANTLHPHAAHCPGGPGAAELMMHQNSWLARPSALLNLYTPGHPASAMWQLQQNLSPGLMVPQHYEQQVAALSTSAMAHQHMQASMQSLPFLSLAVQQQQQQYQPQLQQSFPAGLDPYVSFAGYNTLQGGFRPPPW